MYFIVIFWNNIHNTSTPRTSRVSYKSDKCVDNSSSNHEISLWYAQIFFFLVRSNSRTQGLVAQDILTIHACRMFLTSVVWTYNTFANKFGIKQKLEKYLKEICLLQPYKQFSFKYFLKIVFVRVKSLKCSGSFGRYRHEWVNARNLWRCDKVSTDLSGPKDDTSPERWQWVAA